MVRQSKKSIFIFLVWFILPLGIIYLAFSEADLYLIVLKVIVLLIMIFCLQKGQKEKTILNPYFLFALTPFSILIYKEAISTWYLQKLEYKTWIIAIINMLSFLGAFTLCNPSKGNETNKSIDNKISLKNHFHILLILSLLPYIYGFIIGFPMLASGNLFGMKSYLNKMPLASVFNLFMFPAIVCALKSKDKKSIVLTISIIFVQLLMGFSKTSILYILIIFLLSYEKFYNTKTPKSTIKLIALTLAALIAVLYSFSYMDSLRSGGSIGTASYYESLNRISWSYSKTFFLPYMYLVNGWNNLQYVMNTQNSRTFGLWLIKPFLGYFQLKGHFEEIYQMVSYSSFNTFTFISFGFKDFGFIGSCISAIILGIFVKKVYTKYLKSESPLDLACYAMTAGSVLEMFFSNEFLTQSFPFTIIIIMWIYRKFFIKPDKKYDTLHNT